MQTATAQLTPSNADVLPLIQQLGAVPKVMRDYTDNMVVRDKDGLSVYLSFNRAMTPGEVAAAGQYCAAAFNLLNFKNAVAVPCGLQQDHGASAIKMCVANDDIPGSVRAAWKKNENELDVMEKVDSIEQRWKALRVIRQAALLA